MERKDELATRIGEIKKKIEKMGDRQAKLKVCSSIYKAILELDDMIAESGKMLKDLEIQFAHTVYKDKKHHWDSLEQNIYRSADSFHKCFTKAGTMFKRFK